MNFILPKNDVFAAVDKQDRESPFYKRKEKIHLVCGSENICEAISDSDHGKQSVCAVC